MSVSATFVGQVRRSLEADEVIDAQSKRIDRSGRKLETENIGAKLKPAPSEAREFWDQIQQLPTNELRRYRFWLDELINNRENDEF